MSNEFFDERMKDLQEPESEYMSPEEADALERKIMNSPAPKTYNTVSDDKFVDEVLQEEGYLVFSDEDLENDEELISDVELRLEQGRLYQMILKHDLFANVDAPPKAIANVQREIRQHIRNRLAVLLGITPEQHIPQKKQEFPFTDVEVGLLKTLLAKLSGGATEKYKEVPEEATKDNKINSVSEKKSQTIAPFSSPKNYQKVAENRPTQSPQKSGEYKKTLPSNPNRIKTKLEQIRELEADIEANYKPIQEMTPQEKQERNVKAAKLEALKKTPRPSNAIPMPSIDMSNSMYAAQGDANTRGMLNGPIGRGVNGR